MFIRKYSPTLVLRKFQVNAAASGGALIEVVGRPAGILGWLLTVLGLASETTLTVTAESVCVNNASLSGQTHHVVPLRHVSHSSCGYVKPIGILIFGLVEFIFLSYISLIESRVGGGPVLIGLLILAACCVGYFLSKKLSIMVVADSGVGFPLTFKPSVIEGVSVDMARAMEVIDLLNGLIMRAAP